MTTATQPMTDVEIRRTYRERKRIQLERQGYQYGAAWVRKHRGDDVIWSAWLDVVGAYLQAQGFGPYDPLKNGEWDAAEVAVARAIATEVARLHDTSDAYKELRKAAGLMVA